MNFQFEKKNIGRSVNGLRKNAIPNLKYSHLHANIYLITIFHTFFNFSKWTCGLRKCINHVINANFIPKKTKRCEFHSIRKHNMHTNNTFFVVTIDEKYRNFATK